MRYLTRGIDSALPVLEAIDDQAHEDLFMERVKIARTKKYDDHPDTRGMQWVGRNKLFKDPKTFANYGRVAMK